MADNCDKQLVLITDPIEKPIDLSAELNKLRSLAKHDNECKTNLNSIKRDLHNQRLKGLRELSDKLKDESWKYTSVDKLLGL